MSHIDNMQEFNDIFEKLPKCKKCEKIINAAINKGASHFAGETWDIKYLMVGDMSIKLLHDVDGFTQYVNAEVFCHEFKLKDIGCSHLSSDSIPVIDLDPRHIIWLRKLDFPPMLISSENETNHKKILEWPT